MLPAVAAAAAAFAFFFEGCTPQKPTSTRGQHGEQKDRYVEPKVNPMEKYERSYGSGRLW